LKRRVYLKRYEEKQKTERDKEIRKKERVRERE